MFVRPRRWSIRAKSFALLISYALALLAVYFVFSVRLLRGEAAAANERLELTARMIAAEIDAFVGAGRQRLATVAQLPGLVFGLRTMGDAHGEGHIPPWTTLHYLFFRSPVFTGGVFLLDQVGKVLWTEPPGLPWVGQNLAPFEPIATVYRDGRDVISGALGKDPISAAPHVTVVTPIQSPTGETVGVLGGVIDLSAPEFTAVLNATSTSQGRFVAVLDAGGLTLAATNGVPPLAVFDAATASRAESLSAGVSLSQAAWRVVAGQPRETALAETRKLQDILIVAGICLVLLAVALGVPIIRGFVRSINTLTRHAQVMAGGDLSQPVHVPQHQDEIATLARTFDHMRVELQRSRDALTRRLEEREELVRLKEEFLANVSHELRTPLNVIMGYADMLSEGDVGVDEREVLCGIRTQAEHLLSLVSDLMTLSALNTGRVSLQVSRVNIAEAFARLEPLVSQLRRGRDIEVTWACHAALPLIETDPFRLQQMLSNLITNAFKFTPHGRITISAAFEPTLQRVVLRVADTGIGIPSHEIPHIFDEFRQVDGSMSRVYGGIGLGLALVQKLTVLLGGELHVVSEVDVGSTFCVSLPLRLAARVTTPPATDTCETLAGTG